MYLHLYTVLGLIFTTAVLFYLLPKQNKFIQILAIVVWMLGCTYVYISVMEKSNNKIIPSTDIIV